MRSGLKAVITSSQAMCLVGEASTGCEAIGLYRELRPDLVLMDMSMPLMDGLKATRAIREEFPTARILIFSISTGDETIYRAIQAGARGYLFKDTSVPMMLKSIEDAVDGQMIIPNEVAVKLTGHLQLRDLTSRELEVLELIVAGKSNSEIGEILFICEGTVKSHVNRLLEKLHVADRTQAAVAAIRRGLVWL